jgi:competence protein ComEC
LAAALTVVGFIFGRGRTGRALGWFAFAATLGCALVWARSVWVAAPRLDRAVVTDVAARVESVDYLHPSRRFA